MAKNFAAIQGTRVGQSIDEAVSEAVLRCKIAFRRLWEILRVKGAEMRHLLRALMLALDHVAKPQADAALFAREFEIKGHRRLAGEGLLAFYNAVEQGGMILTPDAVEQRKSGGMQYLIHYQKLARASMDEGRFEWSVVNKHHFFYHLCQETAWENPKNYWCYSGEDFVGRISRLGRSCANGTRTNAITIPLVSKYRLSVHFRLSLL